MIKMLLFFLVITLIAPHSLHSQNSTAILEDASIDSNTQKAHSAYPYTTGNAIDFDGSNQYADCGTLDLSGTAITMECWVNIDQFQTTAPYTSTIMGADDGANNTALLNIGDGTAANNHKVQFVLMINGSLEKVTSNTELLANRWYHIAVTYKIDLSMRITIDGRIDIGYVQNVGFISNAPFYLAQSSSGNYFDGSVDEVRVWSDLRTLDEIRQNMCRTLLGTEAGLVLYYPCNASSGSTLTDRTSNGHNATLYNSPSWIPSDAFNMWLGGADDKWTTASNWGLGSVPNSLTSNVGITDQTTTYFPQISSDITTGSVCLNSGSSLTILPLANVTMSHLNNYGTCVVKSDATGTGSLIINIRSVVDLTVERFLTQDRWHYISAQTAVSGSFETLNMGLGTAGNSSNQFYRWEEGHAYGSTIGCWVDILNGEDGSGSNSLMDDESFVVCKGYAITYAGSDKTLSLMGVHYNSNQTILLQKTAGSYGEGSNLVGNPFTATIAINENAQATLNVLSQNSAALDDSFEAIYIWDESSGWDGVSNSDYDAYNNTSSALFVEPGQAFMVMAAADEALFSFKKNTWKHGDASFYKSEKDQSRLSLKLRVSDGVNLSNSTELVFLPGMTLGLDPSYDAGKFKGNPNIALYTRLVDGSGNDFAIQALPDENLESYLIPVGIDVAEAGLFTFSINQENLGNYNILLEDHLMNTVTNLRWETYSTTIEESGVGRFFLQLKDATPVEGQTLDSKIQIYTAEGDLFVKGSGKGELKVLDAMGREVMKAVLSESDQNIIPHYLKKGIYVVLVYGKNGVKTQKVVIK